MGVAPKGVKFRYNIQLNPGWETGQSIYREPGYLKDERKEKILKWLRLYFFYQIQKAKQNLNQKAIAHYYVSDYLAPEVLQFICPTTGMAATQTDSPDVIRKTRFYWFNVFKKSEQIYEYLLTLSTQTVSYHLYLYLRRLVVIPNLYPWEIERYEESFKEEN